MTRNAITIPDPQSVSTPAPLIPVGWVPNVVVPVAQNIAGGVGAFILALIAALKLGGAPLQTAAEIALIVAGLVFGVAMLIRAFRDEVTILVGAWASRHDRATQEALQRQIAGLTAELERLRKVNLLENRYTAQAAAEQLLFDHYRAAGGPLEITRAAAMKRGMTRPAWEAGVSVLRKAGVTDDHGRISAPSYTAAMSAVLRHMATSTTYVRTADGDFAKL